METRNFSFLVEEEEHRKTELLTMKQQIIILPFFPVTLLSPSAHMDPSLIQVPVSQIWWGNHIRLMKQAKAGGPQGTHQKL